MPLGFVICDLFDVFDTNHQILWSKVKISWVPPARRRNHVAAQPSTNYLPCGHWPSSRLLGSKTVARSILQAASVHLTPVTLELGGKCPCIIFGRVNIEVTVRRLVWSKFFNAGQSCVAPDYVLCSPATRDALLPALREALEDFYTKEPQLCPDFSRIVSPRHWTRLMELLKRSSGKVVMGGENDQEDKYIGELK